MQTHKISRCITNISLLTISSPISVYSGDALDVQTQERQSCAFMDLHKTVSWTASLPRAANWSLHYKIICRNVISPPSTQLGLFSKAETCYLWNWYSPGLCHPDKAAQLWPQKNARISAFRDHLSAAAHQRANSGCVCHLISPASQCLLCPALKAPCSADPG